MCEIGETLLARMYTYVGNHIPIGQVRRGRYYFNGQVSLFPGHGMLQHTLTVATHRIHRLRRMIKRTLVC